MTPNWMIRSLPMAEQHLRADAPFTRQFGQQLLPQKPIGQLLHQRARLRQHALGRLGARFVEQFGIGLELTTNDVLEPGEDVLAHVLAAHGGALHQPKVAGDGLAGDAVEIADFHELS